VLFIIFIFFIILLSIVSDVHANWLLNEYVYAYANGAVCGPASTKPQTLNIEATKVNNNNYYY